MRSRVPLSSRILQEPTASRPGTHLSVTALLLAGPRSWPCGVSGRGLSLAGEPGPEPSDISEGVRGTEQQWAGLAGRCAGGWLGARRRGLGGARRR